MELEGSSWGWCCLMWTLAGGGGGGGGGRIMTADPPGGEQVDDDTSGGAFGIRKSPLLPPLVMTDPFMRPWWLWLLDCGVIWALLGEWWITRIISLLDDVTDDEVIVGCTSCLISQIRNIGTFSSLISRITGTIIEWARLTTVAYYTKTEPGPQISQNATPKSETHTTLANKPNKTKPNDPY